MAEDIMLLFFCCASTFVIGFCIGHTVLHRDAWFTLERISRWLDDTNSDSWVAYHIHQDLETKYEALLREYEQYRGTMKAIDDCNRLTNKKSGLYTYNVRFKENDTGNKDEF